MSFKNHYPWFGFCNSLYGGTIHIWWKSQSAFVSFNINSIFQTPKVMDFNEFKWVQIAIGIRLTFKMPFCNSMQRGEMLEFDHREFNAYNAWWMNVFIFFLFFSEYVCFISIFAFIIINCPSHLSSIIMASAIMQQWIKSRACCFFRDSGFPSFIHSMFRNNILLLLLRRFFWSFVSPSVSFYFDNMTFKFQSFSLFDDKYNPTTTTIIRRIPTTQWQFSRSSQTTTTSK